MAEQAFDNSFMSYLLDTSVEDINAIEDAKVAVTLGIEPEKLTDWQVAWREYARKRMVMAAARGRARRARKNVTVNSADGVAGD